MFMKKVFASVLLLSVLFVSCKKAKSVDEVTYEVVLISATTWDGIYINENAQTVSISSQRSGWKYSFKNTNGLMVATLLAFPNGTSSAADAIMRIYLNGKVVAEQKYSIASQVQYQLP